MAERMRAAGCQVELEMAADARTWQVWARVLPEARAAIERIGAFVQSILSCRRLGLNLSWNLITSPSDVDRTQSGLQMKPGSTGR
jgi:hypothetical protein